MKKIIKLSLFATIIFFLISSVSALTDEEISKLDTKSKIGMPVLITNKGATVNVYNTSNYDLFYQWQEISLETYNNLKSKSAEMDKVYDEAKEYSKTNKPDNSDNDAINKYNEKIKEYNDKIKELNNERYKLLPSFKNDWISVNSSENKVYPPNEVFSGNRPFVLYVKLEDKENNEVVYDYGVLELDGDSKESKIENNSEDTKENMGAISNGTSKISNPKTADVKISLVSLGILVSGLFIVIGFRKMKKKNN